MDPWHNVCRGAGLGRSLPLGRAPSTRRNSVTAQKGGTAETYVPARRGNGVAVRCAGTPTHGPPVAVALTCKNPRRLSLRGIGGRTDTAPSHRSREGHPRAAPVYLFLLLVVPRSATAAWMLRRGDPGRSARVSPAPLRGRSLLGATARGAPTGVTSAAVGSAPGAESAPPRMRYLCG